MWCLLLSAGAPDNRHQGLFIQRELPAHSITQFTAQAAPRPLDGATVSSHLVLQPFLRTCAAAVSARIALHQHVRAGFALHLLHVTSNPGGDHLLGHAMLNVARGGGLSLAEPATPAKFGLQSFALKILLKILLKGSYV